MIPNKRKLYIPILLVILAILDLRSELLILLDHLTIISIVYAVKHHLLAVSIILFSPSLFRVYSKN